MKFRSQVYTAVSGSIGGLTYSHNKGGMYTRGRATPTNPNTAAQQDARMAMSTLSTAWRDSLTAAQRIAWEAYAVNTPVADAFGEPLVLSGQQMYIRCNAPRVRAALARVDDGPTVFGQADLSPLALFWNGGVVNNFELSFDDTDAWANAAGGYLLIQTSHMVSGTINFLKGPFRYLDRVVGDAVPPISPFATAYTAFTENCSFYSGSNCFFRVRASNADGRLSPTQILTGTVA